MAPDIPAMTTYYTNPQVTITSTVTRGVTRGAYDGTDTISGYGDAWGETELTGYTSSTIVCFPRERDDDGKVVYEVTEKHLAAIRWFYRTVNRRFGSGSRPTLWMPWKFRSRATET